jgi:RNA polymerase sigma-70 factor (ECF subfamily)
VSAPETPSPPSEPDLLRRAQAGDEAAFGELMHLHYPAVFRLVQGIVRHEQDARDVCQEVWLTAWRRLGDFRGEARFTTWMHPIAVRRAIDHLRKRRRWYERFLPFEAIEHTAVAAATEAFADTDPPERTRRLRAALDALPPRHRAVLALRELEGLSYEEIAAAVKIPVGTVMSRLYHARRLLALKLGMKP